MRPYKIFAVSLLSLVLVGINARAENAPVVDLNSIPEDSTSFSSDTSSAQETAPDSLATRKSLSMGERISLLEQQINNLTQMNLPGKLDALEQQINQLNGQIEEQAHVIAQLKEQQKQSQQGVLSKSTEAVMTPAVPPEPSMPDEGRVESSLPAPPIPSAPVVNKRKTSNPATNNEAEPAPSNLILLAEEAVVRNKPLPKNSAKSTTVATTGSDEKAYQAAFDLMVKKKNTAAIAGFKAVIKNYPNSPNYTPSAHYWLGELYNSAGKGALASKEFNVVVQQYPTHSKVSDAMFKLAIIHDDAGQRTQAKQELQKVIKQFPGSTAAKLAKMRLQSMK